MFVRFGCVHKMAHSAAERPHRRAASEVSRGTYRHTIAVFLYGIILHCRLLTIRSLLTVLLLLTLLSLLTILSLLTALSPPHSTIAPHYTIDPHCIVACSLYYRSSLNYCIHLQLTEQQFAAPNRAAGLLDVTGSQLIICSHDHLWQKQHEQPMSSDFGGPRSGWSLSRQQ